MDSRQEIQVISILMMYCQCPNIGAWFRAFENLANCFMAIHQGILCSLVLQNRMAMDSNNPGSCSLWPSAFARLCSG